MCGIAGQIWFRTPPEQVEQTIRNMTDAMSHRGPDAGATVRHNNILFGHRRLSIIDLSEKSNQPLYDKHRRYAIVFNGEIYNYNEVKSLLPDYPFQTSGDTEVVLAAWIRFGPKALSYLKGMFAFAIADLETGKLIIARDRLGVKPVYYYKDDKVLLFSSEIRSILASNLVERKINRDALLDYFSFQSFQSPITLVKDIFELEAGSYLEIDNGNVYATRYWSLTDDQTEIAEKSSGEIYKKVAALLHQSVERRMVSDVPVAAFLSGGIDSSAVVGLMAQISNSPETFNIAFDEVEYDESEYASIIAEKFKTKHHRVLVKPESFLEKLPAALDAMDSPSADGVNTYVVSHAIRSQGIKVALSGVGGDELFVGYPSFSQWKKIHNNSWFWSVPRFLRRIIANTYSGNQIKLNRISQLVKLDKIEISEVYPILRQVNSERILGQLLSNSRSESSLLKTLRSNASEIEKFPIYSQYSIAEYLGYTRQTLLKDTDQMSMSASLEVREPFFDHELIQYVLKIPDSFKEGEWPKTLLLKSLGQMIPEEIYQRPKKGFVFPWDKWFRNELKSYIEDKIKLLAQRNFVNGNRVLSYWSDFLNQRNQVGYTNILLLVALENYVELHRLD